MIFQTILICFCFAEIISATATGRVYDRKKESRALATRTNRFNLDKPRQGRMPVDCLNKCDDPACCAVNVFLNGTCEVLLSPVISVDCFPESTAYIGPYETCPDGFGYTFVTRDNRSCYHFALDRGRIWTEANHYCNSVGGDVVSVETAQELDHLTQITKSYPKLQGRWFWNSGRKVEDSGSVKWIWSSTGGLVNPSLLDRYKVSSSPDCLFMTWRPNDYWESDSCSFPARPLCEVTLG